MWKYVWVKKCVKIHEMLFKNWKWLFENTNQIPPKSLYLWILLFLYIYKRLYILLNIYDTKYAKTTGPCRPWLAQECRCTMPKRFSPELKIKKKKKNHASCTSLYFEYGLSSKLSPSLIIYSTWFIFKLNKL